jgi:hypothetical protein
LEKSANSQLALGRSLNKRSIIAELEYAAAYMRSAIPKAMNLSGRSQASVASTCHRAAESIADLQIKVAVSGNQRSLICREISGAVAAVATGDYARLQSDIRDPGDTRRGRRVGIALRDMTIGLLPIAVVLTLPHIGIALNRNLWNWSVIISLVWLVTVLISILDPDYATRFKVVGSFIAAIRGKG